jgi:hypothetical protein
MVNIIGKIVSGNRLFFIKHPDWTLEVVKVGSTLFEGDKLICSSSNNNENSKLISLVDNLGQTKIAGSNEQLFDITLLSEEDTVNPNSRVESNK